MQPRHLRAYLERGWAVAESLKQQYWAREFNERGPQATFDAAQALWTHMRSLRPEWPTEQERIEDLEHHVALKRAIDRAARVFASVSSH